MLRFAEKLRIHVVRGDCDLRRVIQEVIQKNLGGQHRQEGQENRSASHAEHIAEVGTRTHQQVLHYIAESLASLLNTVIENPEARFDQNDVRGVTSYIHRRRNRDAHIGGV